MLIQVPVNDETIYTLTYLQNVYYRVERTVTQIFDTDSTYNSYIALVWASGLLPRRPFSGLSLCFQRYHRDRL